MSMDYTATITEEGINIHGVQFRNEGPKHVWPIAAQSGDILAINLPPGSCWSGVGRPHRYIPAEIYVFQVYTLKKETRLKQLLSVPTKRKAS